MATILGAAGATEQPIRFGYSTSRGVSTTRTWKGMAAAINALIPQLWALGWEYQVSDSPGGICTLEATCYMDDTGGRNAGRDITNQWEFIPNRVQKDFLESDLAIINSLNDENIENINYYLNNPIEPGANVTNKFTNTGNRTNAVKVYRLMRAGVKSTYVSQPILRHTYMIPFNQRPAFNWTNNGKILSTATLISTEAPPADFLLPLGSLPTTFAAPSRSDSIPLVYGWLKHMPTLTVAPLNRREVVAEWEFGLWSTDQYGSLL